MDELILALITVVKERFDSAIKEAVFQALGVQQVIPTLQDKTDINGACEHLEKHGYKVPKSTLYKLTRTNDIPCGRIGDGRRLIFSRIELESWLESQIKQKPRFNASLELAKSAQRKIRKG